MQNRRLCLIGLSLLILVGLGYAHTRGGGPIKNSLGRIYLGLLWRQPGESGSEPGGSHRP